MTNFLSARKAASLDSESSDTPKTDCFQEVISVNPALKTSSRAPSVMVTKVPGPFYSIGFRV